MHVFIAAICCCLLLSGIAAAPVFDLDDIIVPRGSDAAVSHNLQSVDRILYTPHQERALGTSDDLASGLINVSVIGPFLTPLVPFLQDTGLAGLSTSTADPGSLTADQLTALANLQALLSLAIHNITLPDTHSSASDLTSTEQDPSTSNPPEARGIIDIGSILFHLPIIGSFLKPLLPLLDQIGLGSTSLAAVSDIKFLTLDQASTFAQLEFNLAQAVNSFRSATSVQ